MQSKVHCIMDKIKFFSGDLITVCEHGSTSPTSVIMGMYKFQARPVVDVFHTN